MPSELPASALYTSPCLGRLWQKVHRACSPFFLRPPVRHLYERPALVLRRRLKGKSYHWIALGCAEGKKESLLFGHLPPPQSFHAADTNRALAQRAARRFPVPRKSFHSIDLTSFRFPLRISTLSGPWLITLFGVLPNLDPLPLLRRLRREMRTDDLLLFSTNLAPGKSGLQGARRVLPQYDNPVTRRWLKTAVQSFRPRLPFGHLRFGVFPDPRQRSLARIEARWISGRQTKIVFSSRRPSPAQVEKWIRDARLTKVARFLEPRREEGVWLVTR